MRKRDLWGCMALAALMVIFATGCGGGGAAAGETKKVIVASDLANRPFEFEEGGQPKGFDIDLMNEVAKRADLDVEYQNVTFDGIIPGLVSGLYDVGLSGFTITEEREKRVDFSDPYFNADQSLLTQTNSGIKSTDDLAKANVGVQLGTTGADYAAKLKRKGDIGRITTFDTNPDAFAALKNGQIDAVIYDFPVTAYQAKASGGSLKVAQTIPTGEQFGIALPQDSELRQLVNKALADVKEDGTYAEIYEKWFGEKPKEMP